MVQQYHKKIVFVSLCSLVLLYYNFDSVSHSIFVTFSCNTKSHHLKAKLYKTSVKNQSSCNFRRNLQHVLLAVNFNEPMYSVIPLLKAIYEPYFAKVIFCGPEESNVYDIFKLPTKHGYHGYACLTTAIKKYPSGYRGYIHTNDDVILNVWNLNSNLKRVWTGTEIILKKAHRFGQKHGPKEWHWWTGTEQAAVRCEKAFYVLRNQSATATKAGKNLKKYFTRFYRNTNNQDICLMGSSDVFYIPKQLAKAYSFMADIYAKKKVFLEVAVPTIITFLEKKESLVNMNGMYYIKNYGYSKKYYRGVAFFETYDFNLTFSHPFKLANNPINRRYLIDAILPEMEKRRKNCEV